MEEERSLRWQDIRKQMHKAICERNTHEVQHCLRTACHLRLWLDPSDDESALHRAVQSNAFFIYGLLLSHKCCFKDVDEEQCLSGLNNMQKSELQRQEFFVTKYHKSYLHYLKSRSRSQTKRDHFETQVDSMFEKLDNVEILCTILKVSATSQHLRIRFDFERENVQCMVGCVSRYNLGITDNSTEEIFVAAKTKKQGPQQVDGEPDEEVLGTLAHELCHFALHLVYNNGGKPYFSHDVEKKLRYGDIVTDIERRVRQNASEVDPILRLAFPSNKEEELIVRVPHILAQYGSPGGGILKTQAPELFNFFKEVVSPDMNDYIRGACPGKDAEKILEQNARLGKAHRVDELNVSFDDPMLYNDLQEVPLLLLTAPNLSLLEVLVHDAVKSAGRPYLFLEALQWDEKITDLLCDHKSNFVILTCNHKRKLEKILRFLSEVSDVVGTRVILAVGDRDTEEITNYVKRNPFFRSAGNHCISRIDKATFKNVTQRCKEQVRMKSHIRLQGDEYAVRFSEVMDSETFSQFIDITVFLKLCESSYIEVGPSVCEGICGYYVKRRLEAARERQHDDQYLLDSWEKITVVVGVPGIGKSAMALWLSKKYKERDEKQWVLHINLPRKIGLVDSETDVSDIQQLAILSGVKTQGLEFALFHQCVQNGTPFNIVMIFDAFDEINEGCRRYVLKLIKYLRETLVYRIYLMSRTIFKTMIQDTIYTCPLEIAPFSNDNMINYLERYWRTNGVTAISDDALHAAAANTVASYTAEMKHAATALENPLLIRMIAELEQGSVFRRASAQVVENSGMFEIYRKFADYKYKIYTAEKLQLDARNFTIASEYENEMREKQFYYKLGLLAVRDIFQDKLDGILTNDELEQFEPRGRLAEDVAESRVGHGLVDGLSDGTVGFIHWTFAEFFAAHFLFHRVKDNISKDGKLKDLTTDLMLELYSNTFYVPMLFVDSSAAAPFPLHCAIINGNASYLRSNVTEQNMYDVDEFGRTILHVAALHAKPEVLKVLPINDSLMRRDKFGMTPLMYVEMTRERDEKWRRLNIFCARLSDVEWDEVIPTTFENALQERRLMRSVFYCAAVDSLCALLDLLLRQLCRTQRERRLEINPHLLDIDAIRDDDCRTVLFYAMSSAIFELLLPYCDVRAVDNRGHTPFLYNIHRLTDNRQKQLNLSEVTMPFLYLPAYFSNMWVEVGSKLNNGLSVCKQETRHKGKRIAISMELLDLLATIYAIHSANMMCTSASLTEIETLKLLLLRTRTNMPGNVPLRCTYNHTAPEIIKLLLPHAWIHLRGAPSSWNCSQVHLKLHGTTFDSFRTCGLLISLYYSPEKLCNIVSDWQDDDTYEHAFRALFPYVNTSDGRNYVLRFMRSGARRSQMHRSQYLPVLKHLLLAAPASHRYGCEALHHCIELGHVDVMKLLLPHSNINAKDTKGRTLLQVPCKPMVNEGSSTPWFHYEPFGQTASLTGENAAELLQRWLLKEDDDDDSVSSEETS
ncbi:uncharacterized protein LOC135400265 [Ornithodoros turicata]|uniref:uncharacterized protein LOC135400265 n=1 Tax=Ornithodoros turicata TaxID=34597 RepID=UPI0031386BC0